MIHRDIKSANILLTSKATLPDMEPCTKVADFGTVRADVREKKTASSVLCADSVGERGGTVDMKEHASTQMIIGTPAYMPNEYVTLGHVSEKTDAFALGIVMIELLTTNRATNEGISTRGGDGGAEARGIYENSISVAEALKQHPSAAALGWPEPILGDLADVTDRLTLGKHMARSSVQEALPIIEAALRSVSVSPNSR
jgi:serine/threonine protein kinase